MKSWKLCWIVMLALAVPVMALDEEGTKSGTEKKEDKKSEKPSPIPRLVELRVDEFVVPARVINLPLPGKTKTLQDILDRFDKWTEDEKVGAVLLNISGFGLSLPDVEELRAGVGRLRKADKKVFAFVNGGNPNSYLLATSADEIAIAPTGAILIPGIGRLFPFMKGHYQMLGIEYDVITAGRYKYPGFLNEREPNEFFQTEFGAILDSWIGDYRRMIAESRNLSDEAVGEIIDIALFNADQALQRGLVDTLAYYDEYRDQVLKRGKMKRARDEERGLAGVNSLQGLIELVNDELQRAAEARKAVGPKIAVLHARGPIIDTNLGIGFASQLICRDDFSKVVDELRKNDSIKAVVMRIDSPGGSGYASDVIWTHLRRLNEVKPLVVSMGSVAGSGGYYIACPARRIFAQPTTITGSIGVLGVFQSSRSMFNRIDYEIAEMKRGERSNLGAPHRALAKEDRQFIQDYINDFYDVFLDRVARTRRMPVKEVHKIAEGRIWTGRDAIDIGLVDELGGIAEAIESARQMANIPPSAELKIVHYPRPGSLGEIFESFSMVGVTQVVTAFSQGITAAPPVTFDQQIELFSKSMTPLCWMAVPPFYAPEPVAATNQLQLMGQRHGAQVLEGMPGLGR